MLRVGETLVPLIVTSNGTHPSNFAGDMKEWPVSITIGNLSSKIRQMPSTHSLIMVALLLIPIKNCNMPQKQLHEQRQPNREVRNEVLWQVLQHVTFKQNPGAESGNYNVLCADGNFRHCEPDLAAWLADGTEYSDLHHLERHVCFRCAWPKNELEDYVLPDTQYPRRDQYLYQTLNDTNTKASNTKLSLCHVHRAFNVILHIPCVVSDLPKPDILHTMHIGMHDHVQKWIFHFMKMHKQLDKYNAIWLFLPSYHDLTPKNKSYEEVSQWNGKELKELSRDLLGVQAGSLHDGITAHCPKFNCAIECTQPLLEFYIHAQYESHDDAILSYMEDALRRFRTFKDGFLLQFADKNANAKPTTLWRELVQKGNVGMETNAETRTLSKMLHERKDWWDYISHKIYVCKKLDANSNFPNIHLMSHWAEQICWYGALQQYSADSYQEKLKTDLQDSWNTLYHNLNYLRQVISYQCCILCFKIRDLIPQTLTNRRQHSAAAYIILPYGADRAYPLSFQSYANPQFMGPRNRNDGKQPHAGIKDFRALLDNPLDATHRVAMYSSTRELIKHQGRNKMYISGYELHPMELCVYHCFQPQVEDLGGERISQMCGWTESQS